MDLLMYPGNNQEEQIGFSDAESEKSNELKEPLKKLSHNTDFL